MPENVEQPQKKRINIIGTGPRAGDEPGINMWTGNPTPEAAARKPLRAAVVPEHHWADGIVHAGVHPGTGNVAPTADAAWHERSAVHRALEERSPGDTFTHQDVSAHVQAIKTILGSETGRKLLGRSAEDYERAANALPSLVPTTNTLRSSSRDSRPSGAVADRMAQLAGPLVRVANELLARTGQARRLGQTPAPAKPEDAPVEWTKVTPPEVTPTIKPAGDEPPIKVAGARDVKRVNKDILDQNAAEAAKPTWEHVPIPVVKSVPGETGRTGHRWNALRELAKSGATRDQMIGHLKKVFFLTHRNASDTLRRWARAESVANGLRSGVHTPEPQTEEPLRLARPGANVLETQLSPKHLTGTSHEFDTGGFGTKGQPGGVKTKRVAIDPQIAGTSLAYHLRQIAQEFGHPTDRYSPLSIQPNPRYTDQTIASLAEHALSGTAPKGFNGDPYAALGQRLRDVGHPLARAYNWQRMGDTMSRDKWVEHTLGEHVEQFRQEGENDSTLWDRVHRAMRDKTDWGMGIWRHLADRMKQSPGAKGVLFDKSSLRSAASILDSVHRVSDRHLDRDYLAAVAAEKGRGESHDENSPLYWRKVMEDSHGKSTRDKNANAKTRHMKFHRQGSAFTATRYDSATLSGDTNRESPRPS
jgi:hypothetical protein